MAFHVLNSWEEEVDSGTVVKVITCDYSEIDLDQITLADDMTPGRWVGGHLEKCRLSWSFGQGRVALFGVPHVKFGGRADDLSVCVHVFFWFLARFLLLRELTHSVNYPITSCYFYVCSLMWGSTHSRSWLDISVGRVFICGSLLFGLLRHGALGTKERSSG